MRYRFDTLRFLLAGLAAFLPLAAQAETACLRIRFGLTDAAPRSWNGSVRVSGGAVTMLQSWRPRKTDRIEGTAWKLATTEGRKFRYRAWEPEPSTPVPDYVNAAGLILTVETAADAEIDISTVNGDFSFRLGEVARKRMLSFLDGGVSVERAAPPERITSGPAQNDFPDLISDGAGGFWTAWIAYRSAGNAVMARRGKPGSWSEPVLLSAPRSDVYQTRLGRDGDPNGKFPGDLGVWVVWSQQVEGNFDLYARRFDGNQWARVERLTDAPGPDIHHVTAADSLGRLWLVWQGFRGGRSHILARRFNGVQWSPEERISISANDDWSPAIAADSQGGVYVGWDTYDKGNYDILMRRYDGEAWSDTMPIADSLRHEAYVSLTCDAEDRLWAVWNESDMQWGKDTGLLVRRPATQLYQSRWMRAAAYAGGEWRRPAAALETSLPADLRGFNDLPAIAIDPQGRPAVVFRHRLLRQREVPFTAAAHRASWETYVTALAGEEWTHPLPIPVTGGRSDHLTRIARGGQGRLFAVWATDHRNYDDYLFQKADVYFAAVPGLGGSANPAQLEPPRSLEALRIFTRHPNEAENLARIRNYRIESEGKTYRIFRGDTHRHTEWSADGNNDGSITDTYRYALNAAELDYLGLSEHHNNGGPNIEYINWLLGQRVDVYTVPGRFVPIYGYERGAGYPNGHRNIFFATRGNPTFPDRPGERETSSGRVGLFDYLKKYDGISIPHTSATNMGTDWRDDGGDLEPLVEIYQGDRVSAEYEGAPKAASAYDETSHAGGFRPAGYVWNAWAKGYKLGVQASSDHLSTHISYACAIAEEFTREGLLDAMRKRHSYGATDNIVLDYRLQADGKEYIQGDIAAVSSRKPKLIVKVIGTAPIRRIDIVRGQEFIHTVQNQDSEIAIDFVDNDAPAGDTYYYVRVLQANEQIAWSSPIWIAAP